MGRSAKKAKLQLTFKDKVLVVLSATVLIVAMLLAMYLSAQMRVVHRALN